MVHKLDPNPQHLWALLPATSFLQNCYVAICSLVLDLKNWLFLLHIKHPSHSYTLSQEAIVRAPFVFVSPPPPPPQVALQISSFIQKLFLHAHTSVMYLKPTHTTVLLQNSHKGFFFFLFFLSCQQLVWWLEKPVETLLSCSSSFFLLMVRCCTGWLQSVFFLKFTLKWNTSSLPDAKIWKWANLCTKAVQH